MPASQAAPIRAVASSSRTGWNIPPRGAVPTPSREIFSPLRPIGTLSSCRATVVLLSLVISLTPTGTVRCWRRCDFLVGHPDVPGHGSCHTPVLHRVLVPVDPEAGCCRSDCLTADDGELRSGHRTQ